MTHRKFVLHIFEVGIPQSANSSSRNSQWLGYKGALSQLTSLKNFGYETTDHKKKKKNILNYINEI